MNEHALTKKVREMIESDRRAGVPIWGLKTSGGPYQRVGVPDWLLCVNGQFGALELKHPNGETDATPRQLREIELIRKAGGLVYVARSMVEVEALIDELRLR